MESIPDIECGSESEAFQKEYNRAIQITSSCKIDHHNTLRRVHNAPGTEGMPSRDKTMMFLLQHHWNFLRNGYGVCHDRKVDVQAKVCDRTQLNRERCRIESYIKKDSPTAFG